MTMTHTELALRSETELEDFLDEVSGRSLMPQLNLTKDGAVAKVAITSACAGFDLPEETRAFLAEDVLRWIIAVHLANQQGMSVAIKFSAQRASLITIAADRAEAALGHPVMQHLKGLSL